MARRFRHRLGGASRLKSYIPKGGSSESNPECSKHRDAAKSVRFASTTQMVAVDEPATSLAQSADTVLQQIPLQSMRIAETNEEDIASNLAIGDAHSVVSEGGASHFSAFTSCTNPTFDAIHRVWKSGSLMQKDVVAVLAAVAEIIKEENGQETDVEYFAALMTALESTPREATARVAAAAYLLNLIVKKVGKEILRKYSSRIIKVLFDKLTDQAECQETAVLKNLLSVLGTVLRAQPASIWQESSNRMLVANAATFVSHEKPWVRTMARRVVRAIITDPVCSSDSGVHPAAGPVGEYAVQQLERCCDGIANDMLAIRILCLLEGIMHKMPQGIFKRLAETVLRLLTHADGTIKCSALQCLYRALQHQPSDSVLPVEVNAQLILAVRDYPPPPTDIAVTAYWMQALGEAHVCLSAKDSTRSLQLLPKTFEMLVRLFDVGHEPLAEVISNVLVRLIECCVQNHAQMATRCLEMLDKALNLQSTPVWRFILKAEMKAFEECGEVIESKALAGSFRTLAQLRESDDCFCKGDLELALGAAVRYVGVEAVLRAIPLNINPDLPSLPIDFQRSWLLPVLRVNVRNAPLSIFIRYFLPLAVKLHKRIGTLSTVPAKLYGAIQMQLWELLPSFLCSPTDFNSSYPELAPVMGAALAERHDLRLVVLSSLRAALRFASQPDATDGRAELMRGYAKNYLPILFNIYTNDEATAPDGYDVRGVRLATLETVRMYMDLTPSELIQRYSNSAIEKSADADNTIEKRVRILDLLATLARCADAKTMNHIFTSVHELFKSNNAALQKKAYRILEELLKRYSDAEGASFFAENIVEVDNLLDQELDCVALSVRASFIAVLHLKLLTLVTLDEVKNFVLKVVKRIIFCLDKTHSIHTRTNAYKCLLDVCQKLITLGSETSESPSCVIGIVLNAIYEMSTPQAGKHSGIVELEVARSTMVALNIIAQKYVRILDASNLSRVMAHACSWISDGRPAVRVIVIRLFRILVKKLPDYALQQYRDLLLQAVFDGQLTADVTVKVRKANRLLLEALVDRYGFEILLKHTSKSDWVKQLKAIEKIRRRKERRALGLNGIGGDVESDFGEEGDIRSLSTKSSKTARADTILDLLENTDDENDSGVDADDEKRSRSGRLKSNSVWLKEGGEDDMIDLLDRNAMIEKITTTKPAAPSAKKTNAVSENKKDNTFGGFKLTEDGRLIIDDLDSLSNKKRRHDAKLLEDEEVEKRRRTDSEKDNDESDSDDTETVSTRKIRWMPGGSGIHRDTSTGGLKPSQHAKNGRKKGHGDVKKKGAKFQPYAYVPLRRKGKMGAELRRIISGAKKGAAVSSRSSRRNGR
ncbi:hypothetical protein AB6A40_001859 [Gnathostoma spinigerum]|uniref:Ribosomal RNA-processing protein 12-like conserved domain-containing protein n=1 Tax=Gnathostoma spinigerum TaxID=75299 RepID=A0ABD6EFQ9_9BILA